MDFGLKENVFMGKKVELVPIAMRRPTEDFIYAPSKIRPTIEISQEEFNQKYADNGKSIQVSFAKDGISDPQSTTTYTGRNAMRGRVIVK